MFHGGVQPGRADNLRPVQTAVFPALRSSGFYLTHTYAFVGLTPSERSLLESIFALDADVDPGEALVPVRLRDDGEGADLLIANGDDLAVVERLSARYPDALLVLVGQPPGGHKVPWPVMRRPLDLYSAVNVLSELDWPETVRRRAPPVRRAAPPARPRPVDDAGSQPSPVTRPPNTDMPSDVMSSAFAPTTVRAPMSPVSRPPADSPLSARRVWAVSEPGDIEPVPTPGQPETPTEPQAFADAMPQAQRFDILVVHGRQDGVIPSLARGLHRMGYSVTSVASADAALAEMKRYPSHCVFLEQPSLGAQVLPLARALDALRGPSAQLLQLAIVARTGSAFDRLRARLAGAVWMKVPIDRERLVAYLERRGVPRPSQAAKPAQASPADSDIAG